MMVFSRKYQRNQVQLTKMLQNCFPLLLQYIGTFIFVYFKSSFYFIIFNNHIKG